jgi:hypothetical protein
MLMKKSGSRKSSVTLYKTILCGPMYSHHKVTYTLQDNQPAKHSVAAPISLICYSAAKLVETGTYAGEEDDDVLFDEMVDDYEDEDEAIDAVSTTLGG